MWIPVVLALISAGAPTDLAQDTVFPVRNGMRLEVEIPRGEVSVRAWERDAVAVVTESGRGVRANRTGSVLSLRPDGRRAAGDSEVELRIPTWMAIRIAGNQLDVEVRGTAGDVAVETVAGDIFVEGGAGLVALRAVQGSVEVRNARGRIEVVSVNDDVTLTGIVGDITADATNGDIVLRDVRAASAQAKTVNGDLRFAGTLQDGGRYAFTTHNGDVVITVPAETNATVGVSTYHGEFDSAFPVQVTTTGRRQFEFVLGSGSARVQLETFNGEIRLRRP